MRLLASALPRVRRLIPTGHGILTFTFVLLLVGLELVGRVAASDLHDGLAALVLASGVALVASRHRRHPIPWVSWLRSRLGWLSTKLESVRYDHGIDLRGSPPFPRKLPPVVWLALAALSAWASAAALLWVAYPAGWRELGTRGSYILYLVTLLALWTGLLSCFLAGVYVPILLLDHWIKGTVRAGDRRGVELVLIVAYMMMIFAVAWLIPTAVVLVLCLVVAVGAAVAMIRRGTDEPAILWRTGQRRTIYAVPLRRIVAGGLVFLALLVFDLLLTACGGRLLTPPERTDTMPGTALLGTIAAWMVPGLVLVAVLRLWAGRRIDPAARSHPTVHASSLLGTATLKRTAAAVALWGWKTRTTPDEPDSGDVRIELVPPEKSEATEFGPRWPLKVSMADVADGTVKDRLARRDEIQLRRHAIRGLTTLFKRAVADRGPKGGGYWFAPHWWFITGLDREDPHRGRSDRPTPPRPVGPPFHRVFPPRVRQHFHEMLRAVQVDMIFVEDGVGHRTVEKIVRAMFELYDKHAGQRRAEDHYFRDVPKVRVMVHDYAPGNPFRTTKYLEPQFDDLSRARVMHVFRDSGGDEADVEVPFDFSWEPSPALGIE
ncbi:hypothetical protein [Fimbriiglobus ruber]|uniref:Uncharacterized protein n=1 Tax=Fimbriiglobus ruber TaxID=1908690 RepID=A0A225DUA3_9BACT|nr:hypothetical protein [Fimbriiglobus ruber]OWK39727.1 hypothetical protein FRUB_05617 [Fimbriiglobus ruber]